MNPLAMTVIGVYGDGVEEEELLGEAGGVGRLLGRLGRFSLERAEDRQHHQ